MTPEEARALLDGTTPGPWELSSSRSVVGIDIVMYDGTVMERRNVALAAAAPVLAAMIAGMRPEYRTEEWQGGYPGWVPTCPWTAVKPEGSTDPNTRVVRRYVTTEKEIS